MVKALVKRFIPATWWARLRQRRITVHLGALLQQWVAVRATAHPVPRPGTMARVLLVPGDPRALAGSYGDEAMISAVRHMAQEVNPMAVVHTVVCGEQAVATAIRYDLVPEDIWGSANYPAAVLRLLESGKFDAVVALGADVIDGAYDVDTPAKLIIATDLAARVGIPAAILGGSFSKTPDVRLAPFFDQLHADVHVYMRENISLERFGAFTTKAGELVADTAFMLPPEESDAETKAWIKARRAEGKLVCGFNIHPMLLHGIDGSAQDLLVEPAIEALLEVSKRRKIAWLLVPHDNREKFGDYGLLRSIQERLNDRLGNDIRLFGGTRAAHAKAIAGDLDGIVTGRMHLAIGSFGMGTPVACVVYLGKFEGLMKLFDQPKENLITVEQLGHSDQLVAWIEGFLDSLPQLRAKITQRHGEVMALSRRNFEIFSKAVQDPAIARS